MCRKAAESRERSDHLQKRHFSFSRKTAHFEKIFKDIPKDIPRKTAESAPSFCAIRFPEHGKAPRDFSLEACP
jgi:hypothetical protein